MREDREVRIDLAAITANVRALAEKVRGTQVMAVVKQDAYGHGAVGCARAALDGGATWLGVAHVAEALELRAAGITAPVLVLLGVSGEDHEAAIRADIELTAGSPELAGLIGRAARRAGRPARLQLEADTGLSRGGATLPGWPALVEAALDARDAGLAEITGLWSHFACSDIPGHPSIQVQLDAFGEAVEIAEKAGLTVPLLHMANTAAGLTLPEARFGLVRFGGAVYGLSTLPGGAPGWLRPAMSLRAKVALVKRVPAGTGVSYGWRYVTGEPTTLGVIPLGYADGIRRTAAGRPLVALRGRRFPIAGTVCMDQIVVDFGDEPVAAGDEVTLFDTGLDGAPTAQTWAEELGTISYEIVLALGPRIPRSHDS